MKPESKALAHVRAMIADHNPTVRQLISAGLDALKPFLQRGAISEARKVLESVILLARGEFPGQIVAPIPMIIHCPVCGMKHVDKEESEAVYYTRMSKVEGDAEAFKNAPERWTNPPHKSHLCAICLNTFRSANVPTVGVAEIPRGKHDTWPFLPTSAKEEEGFHVVIRVERLRWNRKLGSARAIVLDPRVSTPNSDHSFGTFDTAKQADAAILSVITIQPCGKCGARTFADGSFANG